MIIRASLLLAVLGASLTACAGCQKESASDGTALAELTARVKTLEETNAKNAEALAFVNNVIGQQKKEQEAEEARQPAPDAIFAVDITGDQIDGPAGGALVTIIEAWDFA